MSETQWEPHFGTTPLSPVVPCRHNYNETTESSHLVPKSKSLNSGFSIGNPGGSDYNQYFSSQILFRHEVPNQGLFYANTL